MPRSFDARQTHFGRYLEDFDAGDVYRHWPGRTVTEAEGHLFCLLTMTLNPIHVDANYARTEKQYGRNVVVGSFVYSLLLGMSVPDISGMAIASLGTSDLRHVAPMYYGDTLYGYTEIVGNRLARSRPQAGVLTVRTTGTNQDDNVLCTFTRSVLLPCRPGPAGGDDGGLSEHGGATHEH